MKFTLAQIAGAASRGGLDGDDVMHDLLQLAERNGGTPTLREYFIAHAPEHPQPWFQAQMPHPRPVAPAPLNDWSDDERRDYAKWDTEVIEIEQIRSPRLAAFVRETLFYRAQSSDWASDNEKQRYVQWPSAWADEQLRLLAARLIG